MITEPLFDRLMKEWDETTLMLKEMKEKGKLSALDADWLRLKFVRIYDMLLELKTGVKPPEYFSTAMQEANFSKTAKVDTPHKETVILPTEKPQVTATMAPGEGEPVSKETATVRRAEAAKSRQKPEILADKLAGSRKFMHDRLAETIQTDKKDLSTVIKSRPISNIESAIGLNEKFLFIKELFAGNAQHYKETIDTLNNAAGLQDAMAYIRRNFAWDENDPLVMQLLELVQRRHSQEA